MTYLFGDLVPQASVRPNPPGTALSGLAAASADARSPGPSGRRGTMSLSVSVAVDGRPPKKARTLAEWKPLPKLEAS